MVKTKIIETTEKYDKDGKLIEKITREENTEDDETANYQKSGFTNPWLSPTCLLCCKENKNKSLNITW